MAHVTDQNFSIPAVDEPIGEEHIPEIRSDLCNAGNGDGERMVGTGLSHNSINDVEEDHEDIEDFAKNNEKESERQFGEVPNEKADDEENRAMKPSRGYILGNKQPRNAPKKLLHETSINNNAGKTGPNPSPVRPLKSSNIRDKDRNEI
ncbi:hypothetical protein FGB62_359g01 [Gracilaria domingensis]|nr:hypothetical protein FGB62_359g01 [Gracilaria domingensis]